MQMKTKRVGEELIIAPRGELDHHSASEIRQKIDTLLASPAVKVLTFDLSGVTFMDSSGIGVILARSNIMRRRRGVTRIRGAKGQIERVLRLSGVYSLAQKGE